MTETKWRLARAAVLCKLWSTGKRSLVVASPRAQPNGNCQEAT